jgi:hypothetical protein
MTHLTDLEPHCYSLIAQCLTWQQKLNALSHLCRSLQYHHLLPAAFIYDTLTMTFNVYRGINGASPATRKLLACIGAFKLSCASQRGQSLRNYVQSISGLAPLRARYMEYHHNTSFPPSLSSFFTGNIFPHLRHLVLVIQTHNRVAASDIVPLFNLPSLTHLNAQFTCGTVIPFGEKLDVSPQYSTSPLKTLVLHSTIDSSCEWLPYLHKAQTLKYLSITMPGPSDTSLRHLVGLTTLVITNERQGSFNKPFLEDCGKPLLPRLQHFYWRSGYVEKVLRPAHSPFMLSFVTAYASQLQTLSLYVPTPREIIFYMRTISLCSQLRRLQLVGVSPYDDKIAEGTIDSRETSTVCSMVSRMQELPLLHTLKIHRLGLHDAEFSELVTACASIEHLEYDNRYSVNGQFDELALHCQKLRGLDWTIPYRDRIPANDVVERVFPETFSIFPVLRVVSINSLALGMSVEYLDHLFHRLARSPLTSLMIQGVLSKYHARPMDHDPRPTIQRWTGLRHIGLRHPYRELPVQMRACFESCRESMASDVNSLEQEDEDDEQVDWHDMEEPERCRTTALSDDEMRECNHEFGMRTFITQKQFDNETKTGREKYLQLLFDWLPTNA